MKDKIATQLTRDMCGTWLTHTEEGLFTTSAQPRVRRAASYFVCASNPSSAPQKVCSNGGGFWFKVGFDEGRERTQKSYKAAPKKKVAQMAALPTPNEGGPKRPHSQPAKANPKAGTKGKAQNGSN